MRTFYNKLAVLGLLGFVLAACGTSNNVVSGHLISKRKVNKGFFFNHSQSPKSDDSEAQQTRQPFIQYSEEASEKAAEESILASASDELIVEETNVPLVSEDAVMETPAAEEKVNATVTVQEQRSSAETKQTKINKTNKAEFRQAKKNLRNAEKSDDVRLLILVIICLFIPPLAVYLHEGKWNTTCWINLLLTILFFLPGLIHGLIVILK